MPFRPSQSQAIVWLLALGGSACGLDGDGSRPAREPSAAQELHFANWEGEIGPTTLEDFERQTGIRVVTEDIVDNVTLQTKLLTGHSGSDVVVPTSSFLGPLVDAGALQEIDRTKLPNWRHLDPTLLARIDALDPGNRYGVPYVWGTQGFAYNVAAVRRALGHEPEPSWRLLFDPVNSRRLSGCGIAWQDGAGSIMTDLALLAVGADPASGDLADLDRAHAALMRVRGDVRYLDNTSRFRTDLATGEICIATGPSGELLQARDLARESRRGVDIRYVIPREGALLWVDLLAIPVDAPHPELAHRFINFLLEPQTIAKVSNAAKYANANRDAGPWLAPSVRDDEAIYPDAPTLARLHLVPARSQDYVRRRTALWTRVRTGALQAPADREQRDQHLPGAAR